jgi:site-specific recombinase XerD
LVKTISEYETWLQRNKSERTVAAYTYTIDRFLRWLGDRSPTAKSVDDFISHLLATGNSNSAAARHLAALKSYFKFLGRKSELEDIEAPRIEQTVPEWFKIEELTAILENTISPMRRAMVAVQFNAGLRFVELQSLELDDIEWEHRGIMFVPAKKRGQALPTFIDLEETTMDYLEAYVHTRQDDHQLLFCKSNGKPVGLKTYNRYLKEKCESLGIPPKSSHALRHGYATFLSEKNVPIDKVSIIMRHSNIRTTMRYNHARREKVMANVPKIFDTETEKAKHTA